MTAKKKATKKPSAPAIPHRKKSPPKAPAKKTGKPKPSKPATPPAPLGQPQHGAAAASSRARRGPTAHQLALPDTDQVRDPAMEGCYAELVAEKEARKAAGTRIAELEAAIQKRFEEFRVENPRDPRAKAYKTADGAVLRPKLEPKLAIQRPPAKSRTALEAAGVGDPDLPDDGD